MRRYPPVPKRYRMLAYGGVAVIGAIAALAAAAAVWLLITNIF